MFGKPKVVSAPPHDPDFPFAPCILVRGRRGKYAIGSTVTVRYADRLVPGFVVAWVDGTYSIQVRPLGEGGDPVCTCTVHHGVPYEDPQCQYHNEENP